MSVKRKIIDIKNKIGMSFRRFKFFVTGLVHNNPQKIKDFFKSPQNRKNAAKVTAWFACPVIFSLLLIFVSAMLNTVHWGDFTDNSTVIPRNSGFLYTQSAVKISLNWTDGVAELVDGKAKVKLTADITPSYLNGAKVDWTSSDESIAKVDGDGVVTAVKTGTVYITASIVNGKYSRQAKLTVIQPVTGIFMETANVTLYTGGSGQALKVKYFPDNASAPDLVWTSKDSKVATVSQRGRVTPVGVGMTEVTAATKDGKFTCKAYVTVINYSVQVKEISIKNTETELEAGSSLNLVASVSPSNAKNKTLIWSSSNAEIASVSQTGRISALKEGSVTITAKAVNGVTSAINLKITPKPVVNTPSSGDNSYTGTGGVTYTAYDITLPGIVQIQMGLTPPPKIWRNGGLVPATEAETAEFMNPANYCDDTYKYQFLDLSAPNGIPVEDLNAYLADKGILAGQGEAFKNAAEQYNVSEVYLIAHACLETGNGTSQLATGVEVNGVTVYNMFGIAAYDDSAVYSGSQKAYKEGWTTPAAAISGGAKWISEYYINSADGAQNTLYKMLWNPDNPGVHQYATAIEWATEQAVNIAKIFSSFPDAVLSYDVPVYSGQTAPEINE